MEEPDGADDGGGFEGQAEEGVGHAAMVLEVCDGAANRPEGVEVGGFGGDGHGEGGVGGLAVEAGAGEDGTGHEVGDGFHGLLILACLEKLPDGPCAGAVTS